MPLTVHARDAGEVATLQVGGELDIATAAEFKDAVGAHAAEGTTVRVDLGDLAFIDSTGVQAVFDVVRAAGDRVTFREQMQPQVRRVFEITGLLGHLPLH